jgi:hypothetical protein
MVTIIEAPNDTVASTLALDEATHGFRRVQTLRAFTAEQMEEILKKNGGEVEAFAVVESAVMRPGSAERPLWLLDKALALFADPAHQHEDRDNRKASRKTNPYADAAERGPEA